MKVVRLLALRKSCLYTSENIPDTHLCWRPSRPHDHSTAGRIMPMTLAQCSNNCATACPLRIAQNLHFSQSPQMGLQDSSLPQQGSLSLHVYFLHILSSQSSYYYILRNNVSWNTKQQEDKKKKWKRSGEEEFLTSWNSSCRISLQSDLALKPSIDSRGGCDAPQLTYSVVSIHFVSLRHCSTSRWCYSHCAVGRIARQQVRKLTVNDIVLQILRNLCVHYVQPHSPPRQSERGHTLLVHPAYYARMIGNSACMN